MQTYKNIQVELTPINRIMNYQDLLEMTIKDCCSWNSFLISQILNIDYCEGFYIDKDGTIVNHAFNRIGNQYFDFSNTKFYPYVKTLYLKRVYTPNEIKHIFQRENKIFITFQGYATDQYIIRYNDELKRELTNECIINNKNVGKILILIEKLKKYVGEKQDNTDFSQRMQFINELKAEL